MRPYKTAIARTLVACLVLLGMSAAASAAAATPELATVPHPDLAALGDVGEQLALEIAALDAALAEPELGAESLAAAFGDLGRLYLAYELWQPAAACFANAGSLAPQEFRWRYYLAYLHRRDGRLEQAATAYEAALALEPEDVPALLRLSELYLQLGRPEAAEAVLARVPAAGDDGASARVLLGKAALARRRYETALEHFEAALEAVPGAGWIHYQIALAYRGLGRMEEARRHLALQGPGSLPMSDPLIEGLGELTAGASVHLRRAMAAYRGGRPEEALAEYRRALESDPERTDVRLALGAMLVQTGDLDGAVAQYREARRLAPDDPLVGYALADALARHGSHDQAVRHLDEILERQGDFPKALRRRAEIHEARGEAKAALADWRRLVELEPWNPELRHARAGFLLRQERPAEAAEDLRHLLDLDPADARVALNLGSLLARLGRPDAADRLRSVLALDADPETLAKAHFNLGLLALRDGRPGPAVEHFEAAAGLQPEWSEGHRRLAEALASGGRFADAAAAWGRVGTLEPDDAAARQAEASALVAAGRYREAAARLEAGLERFPQSGTFAHRLARLLSTCPDPEVRDGERALELASAVARASSTLEHAETLAMAFAEAGRFEEAIGLQREILAFAEQQAESPAAVERLRDALARYQRREPFRLAPPAADGS